MEIEISFKVSINVFDKLKEKGAEFKRKVGDKFLIFDGDGFDLVDHDSLPKNLKEDDKVVNRRSGGKHGKKRWKKRDWQKDEDDEKERGRPQRLGHRRKGSEPSPGRKERLRQFRKGVLDGESETKVAKRAADNHYIMQDVLSDPSMVGADSETEAVAKVASENPGWAKMSRLVDAYDIDVDVDGNVTSPGEGDTGGSGEAGDSGSDLAAEASEAAHADTGDVSTADPGDLGPSTPADYGMDAGTGGGDSAGGDAGGDLGSSLSGGSSGSSTGSSGGGGSGGSSLGGSSGGGDL